MYNIERDIGMKLLFIAISALRTFAMGFSHYSSTVGINKHLTKIASFVFLVWKKISSCASLETSVFHGLACSHAVFKTHQLSLSFYHLQIFFLSLFHSLIINFILLKRRGWEGRIEE
jgi:hypothetical protein